MSHPGRSHCARPQKRVPPPNLTPCSPCHLKSVSFIKRTSGSGHADASIGHLGDPSLKRCSAAPVRVAHKSERASVKPKIVCQILLQNSVLDSRGAVENDHDRADVFGARCSESRHAGALWACTRLHDGDGTTHHAVSAITGAVIGGVCPSAPARLFAGLCCGPRD
jgi:hypothetical protein